MSIRFKFRSSVNFDTVEIGNRASISVGDLRAKILRGKFSQHQQQGFDLIFSDAVSGLGTFSFSNSLRLVAISFSSFLSFSFFISIFLCLLIASRFAASLFIYIDMFHLIFFLVNTGFGRVQKL